MSRCALTWRRIRINQVRLAGIDVSGCDSSYIIGSMLNLILNVTCFLDLGRLVREVLYGEMIVLGLHRLRKYLRDDL